MLEQHNHRITAQARAASADAANIKAAEDKRRLYEREAENKRLAAGSKAAASASDRKHKEELSRKEQHINSLVDDRREADRTVEDADRARIDALTLLDNQKASHRADKARVIRTAFSAGQAKPSQEPVVVPAKVNSSISRGRSKSVPRSKRSVSRKASRSQSRRRDKRQPSADSGGGS